MVTDPRTLQIGQTVAVKDSNFGVQVCLLTAGEAGLTVIEVSPEHLVLEDASAGSRMHIPLYLVNKSTSPAAPTVVAA